MLEVDVLKYAPETMTAEQRQQFFADGYLVLENVVDEAWLQRLRAATAELVELSRNVSESDERFVLEDGHSAATPRVRRLTSPVTHHPTFWDFASSPLMADVAADVCGGDVKFYHSKLNFKWPEGGHQFAWHHDIPAWPHTDYSPVSIGLYMEDCGVEQGPLLAIKGSHKQPLHSMYDQSGNWRLRIADDDMPDDWQANTTALTGPAGSLVLLNCRVIHGSQSNLSPHMRPLLLNVYSSADAMPYVFNPIPSPYDGEIVRGKKADRSSHDPRGCELPPDWSKGYVGPWQHQSAGQAGEQ